MSPEEKDESLDEFLAMLIPANKGNKVSHSWENEKPAAKKNEPNDFDVFFAYSETSEEQHEEKEKGLSERREAVREKKQTIKVFQKGTV